MHASFLCARYLLGVADVQRFSSASPFCACCCHSFQQPLHPPPLGLSFPGCCAAVGSAGKNFYVERLTSHPGQSPNAKAPPQAIQSLDVEPGGPYDYAESVDDDDVTVETHPSTHQSEASEAASAGLALGDEGMRRCANATLQPLFWPVAIQLRKLFLQSIS